MAYNLSYFAGSGAQFFDNNGSPLSGGLLYTYAAGTTTPATTYTTSTGAVANTNPIVLDSAGRPPQQIWISGGVLYKFILKTATGITLGTYDNIPGIDDPTVFNDLIDVTGTNTLLGTEVPPITGYVTGATYSFVVKNTNTGPVTISIDGLGAKDLTYAGAAPLVPGQLVANSIATIEYDGTRFQLMNSSAGIATVTALNGGQLAGLRNKIINGKMEIAQRGTSFPAIATGAYSLDRWLFGNATTGVLTASQQSDVPSGNEFQSSLRFAVTTASTSDAICSIQHRIEGYNARDLIGRTFTLSFWVRSSKTGVHCVSFGNNGNDRSYVLEYTVNVANTWEYKTATVSGGLITAGTWDWTNGIGINVRFALRASVAGQTTAGAWQTGGFVATSSQVNCLDTIGNIFAITGVQLEVGSVATPFEHRFFGMELSLCQRYYYRITASTNKSFGAALAQTTAAAVGHIQFPVSMRSTPSALEQSGSAGDYGVYTSSGNIACTSVPTFISATTDAVLVTFTSTGAFTANNASILAAKTTSAYLGFPSEL